MREKLDELARLCEAAEAETGTKIDLAVAMNAAYLAFPAILAYVRKAERERGEAQARLVELQNVGHRMFSALVTENGVAISSAMVALRNTLNKIDRQEAANGR